MQALATTTQFPPATAALASTARIEYVHHRGSFDDLPLALMAADFKAVYPAWQPTQGALVTADFLADGAQEQP